MMAPPRRLRAPAAPLLILSLSAAFAFAARGAAAQAAAASRPPPPPSPPPWPIDEREQSAATARHRVAFATDAVPPVRPVLSADTAEVVLNPVSLGRGVLEWGDSGEFETVSRKLSSGESGPHATLHRPALAVLLPSEAVLFLFSRAFGSVPHLSPACIETQQQLTRNSTPHPRSYPSHLRPTRTTTHAHNTQH